MPDQPTKKIPALGVEETARMFQAIIETGEEGILVLDSQSDRIEFANSMASQITGFALEVLLGRPFGELLDEENRKIFQSLKQERASRATKFCRETTLISASSVPVVTEMCFASHAPRQSESPKSFIYLRDVSLNKKLIENLRDSEKKYRNLFERVDQGICITTKEGRFLDCNPALLQILGYDSKEEFLNLDITTALYVVPEDRTRFQELIERDGHVKNYEVTFKKKSGDELPVLMTTHARMDDQGEVIGYQGLIIDISERIRMEQELQEKHGFLSNLLESSADCIVVADMRGNVIFFNKAAERLTGYQADEVIGKLRITRFYPLETARDVMRQLRGTGAGGRGRLENRILTIQNKDSEDIPVSLSASIVYEGARELATLGIFTDLRERMKMEKELQETQIRLLQAEKMASLGSLSAGVAHEINNPLGGILIYASLLKEDFEAAGDPRVEDLKKIVDEASRCKEIVKSLLEFGRQTQAKFETVDINRAIIDGLFFLEHQVLFHNIQIVKHLDFTRPEVEGDPNQLKQVFMNMMVNAAEAMSETGGRLTITTGRTHDEASVFISFEDSGCGISREIQSKIFDPFFTTKEVGRGTGLGLSTSYGIIQTHHGSIEVKSEEGSGTLFTIYLPVSRQEGIDESTADR